MRVVKVISCSRDELARTLVKFVRNGDSDVQETLIIAPFGVDSVPRKDAVGVHSETAVMGDSIVMGVVNKGVAREGETRIYSTNAKNDVVMYIHLKDDGTIEFGGTNDFLVRYNALAEGFNQLKADHNELSAKWNAFAASYIPGSPGSVGSPPTLATETVQPSTADISNSKINEFKTL